MRKGRALNVIDRSDVSLFHGLHDVVGNYEIIIVNRVFGNGPRKLVWVDNAITMTRL